jgi:glycosyltransferase involved in cell wall biosynthesis
MAKILFLVRDYFPHLGGVEKHLAHVSALLHQRGHSVTLIVGNPSRQYPDRQVIDSVTIFRIPLHPIPDCREKFLVWHWLARHRRLIQSADIVHCHDVFFWYLPFRFFYPTKPVYVTFHGFEGRFPITRKALITRKISYWFSRGNICVGDFIPRWYGTPANFITYGGVELPSQTSPPHKKRLCLFIGRLAPDTGLPIYVQAVNIFNARHPRNPLQIEFLGDGPLADLARSVGRVHGFQPQIGRYLQNAHFIFTSGYLSILEAMAHRRVVFSVYDSPLKRDYLTMSPFKDKIVISETPDVLANHLEHYLNSPREVRHRIQAACQFAQEQTWDRVADLYLKLWQI